MVLEYQTGHGDLVGIWDTDGVTHIMAITMDGEVFTDIMETSVTAITGETAIGVVIIGDTTLITIVSDTLTMVTDIVMGIILMYMQTAVHLVDHKIDLVSITE